MRYLYGDSTPFPIGYNFLATLEGFMSASTRIVQLDLEAQLLVKQRDELAQGRVKGLEALEQFHTVVMRAVQDTAQKVQHQHALDYARTVAEHATQYIEEHRRTTLASNERDSLQLRGETERRTAEMRTSLEAFLRSARLPVLKTKVSLRLDVDGKEAHHSGTAAFEHPDGIATAFTLAPHRAAAWVSPRKVSDFVQGIDLKVGVEKSWLRGTVTAKQLNVDDWTITQVDMSDDAFELALRRKLMEKDALVFHLRRADGGALAGTVEHPGAAAAEGLPGTLDAPDVAHIERIWKALKLAAREVTEHKEQLIDVSLDGESVLDSSLATPFVVRLVAMFAPIVREIAKRSPNEFELTLKMEADGGRREELYLRKDALLGTLQPLSAKGREVFAPLGLESWVPSKTNAPPAVIASEPPQRENHADTLSMIPSVPPVPQVPSSSKKLV